MMRYAALVGAAATAAVICLTGPAYAADPTPAPSPADGTDCSGAGVTAHYRNGSCVPDQSDAVKPAAPVSTSPTATATAAPAATTVTVAQPAKPAAPAAAPSATPATAQPASPQPPANGTDCSGAGVTAHYRNGSCVPDQSDAVQVPAAPVSTSPTATVSTSGGSLPFTGVRYLAGTLAVGLGLVVAGIALRRRFS